MRITVLGGGLWGTALAQHLSGNGAQVTLWEFDPKVAAQLSKRGLKATADMAEALARPEVLLMVVPSQHVRATAKKARPLIRTIKAVVTASKGLERGSLRTMAEVLDEELHGLHAAVYALSGPSFAKEVAERVPTKVVLAGAGHEPPKWLVKGFDGGAIRIQPWHDRRGVELGGALKNVMAIACGLAEGLGLGANTKAALFTQAMGELEAIAHGAGGELHTVRGLSGLGDLILTGNTPLSRNRTLGEHLGRGKSLKAALHLVQTVAEGAESAEAAVRLAKKVGVKAPLAEAVHAIVAGRRKPKAVVEALGF